MGEVESVSQRKEGAVVIKRIVIGAGVGVSQVVFEKLDSNRGTSPDKFTAIQNIGPLAITTVGILATFMAKKQKFKTIGADLTSSGSAMLAYRAATLAGVANSLRKLRGRGGISGRGRSNFSSSGSPNLF